MSHLFAGLEVMGGPTVRVVHLSQIVGLGQLSLNVDVRFSVGKDLGKKSVCPKPIKSHRINGSSNLVRSQNSMVFRLGLN
jgi:hypothetical protein